MIFVKNSGLQGIKSDNCKGNYSGQIQIILINIKDFQRIKDFECPQNGLFREPD